MNFADRPNADPNFLRAIQRQRDADREQATDLDRLREEVRKAKATPSGAAVSGPGSVMEGITEDVRELVGRGLTDSDIASRLCVHRTTVGEVRRGLGLEPNEKPEPAEFVASVVEMVGQGLTDDQIAGRLSCGRPRVARVREANGLEENRLRRPNGRAIRVRSLIQLGHADETIARLVGVNKRLVSNVREEMRAESAGKAVGQ